FVDPSLRRSALGWDQLDVPGHVRTMVDTVWDQMTPLAQPGNDDAATRRALDASRDAYVQFYAETEALAFSSINAARPRRNQPRQRERPASPSLARRVARRLRRRYRRLLPVGIRRRLPGSP